jgi:hypothetical protein
MVQEALLTEFELTLPAAHSGHGIRTRRKKRGWYLEDLKLCILKVYASRKKKYTKTQFVTSCISILYPMVSYYIAPPPPGILSCSDFQLCWSATPRPHPRTSIAARQRTPAKPIRVDVTVVVVVVVVVVHVLTPTRGHLW